MPQKPPSKRARGLMFHEPGAERPEREVGGGKCEPFKEKAITDTLTTKIGTGIDKSSRRITIGKGGKAIAENDKKNARPLHAK